MKHYAYRTEQSYVDWFKRYILYHDKIHPKDMGESEVQAFLTHLATERNVAASTQNQALSVYIDQLSLHTILAQATASWVKQDPASLCQGLLHYLQRRMPQHHLWTPRIPPNHCASYY